MSNGYKKLGIGAKKPEYGGAEKYNIWWSRSGKDRNEVGSTVKEHLVEEVI